MDDITARVRATVRTHPGIWAVHLVGSRSRGTANALSDWDFQLDTHDGPALVADLPDLVRQLAPLGALWDPLSERATYCAVLPGAVKIEFFPGHEPHHRRPPLPAAPENLQAIDDHFWDCTLWLASKQLGQHHGLVEAELAKLDDFIFAPLGARERVTSIESAIDIYLKTRTQLERDKAMLIDPALSLAVIEACRTHGLLEPVA